MLTNKTILITGGTGSFGKNFAKFLLKNTKLKKLIVFSRDEFKQFYMQKELQDKRTRFFVGDVRDLERLRRAFNGVDIVIHAAALKQIPTIEYNPFEAVKTNVVGSQNVIEAAIDCRVSKALLISSDKAAYPVNLYGATKLSAEKLFVSGNSYSPTTTRFSAVRYGNVIGSRGSIVETLLNEKCEKISLTHPEMTRFWLPLEDSFQLVLFALKKMRGGETFIPKIPSMKLVELIDILAPQAKKKITGIRPGEKLNEVLLTEEEARHSIELEKYFVVLPTNKDLYNDKAYNRYYKEGKKIRDKKFVFASHTNKQWLTKKELKAIIKRT